MVWKTTRVAAALLSLVGIGSTASAVVLTNPGFDADDASGADVSGASGWGMFNSAFTTNDVSPHSSPNTLKIFGPFFQGGGAGVVQGGFAASPGEIWSASAFLRDDTSDAMQGANFAVVKVEFLNAASAVIGAFESPHFTAAAPDNTWVPEEAIGTAPAGTTTAQIVLVHVQLNTPVTGGSVFFDDAAFGLVPEPTSLAVLGIGSAALAMRRRRGA